MQRMINNFIVKLEYQCNNPIESTMIIDGSITVNKDCMPSLPT